MELRIGQESKDDKNFQYITNLKITRKTVYVFVGAGRKRWKSENEGLI